MEEDWRLIGQEEYLQNATLYRIEFPDFWEKAYVDKNKFYQRVLRDAENHVKLFPDTREYLKGEKIQLFWHEHCDFCTRTVMTNTDCVFYCTKDMSCWICKDCYEDFKDKFCWTVKFSDDLFD